MAAPEDARSVPLIGFPLVIVTLTYILLFISLAAVAVRIYVNVRHRTMAADDYIMVTSMAMVTVGAGLTHKFATLGVGTRNEGLNAWLMVEASMYFTVWILLYVSAIVMIKTAICVTLLRILPRSGTSSFAIWLRRGAWFLIGLSWAAWCVGFFGIVLLCRPIQASWDKSLVTAGKAECGTQEALIGISHTITGSSICTDVGCVLLPGLMLWRSQMGQATKLQVFALLSVASVACIATIVRAPYINRYANPEDNLLYWVGYMILFSNIEMSIGLFAASLPALRRLWVQLVAGKQDGSHGSASAGAKKSNGSIGLVTIGGTGMPRVPGVGGSAQREFSNPTNRGFTKTHVEVGDGDWERLADENGSDKSILSPKSRTTQVGIRADLSYTVEVESHSVDGASIRTHKEDASRPGLKF